MKRPFPKEIEKIGIFSLSFGSQGREYLENTIQRMRDWGVSYWMIEPVNPLRYMAGIDKARGATFNSLLLRDDVDFLLAMRGGFGAARALPYVDWKLFLERNIPLGGFSDMTAFLLAAYGKGYKKGIFGVMAESTFGVDFSADKKVISAANTFRKCLEGKIVSMPGRPKLKAINAGSVTAPVVPANLTVLMSLIGTPWMPDLTGCILVLEGIAISAVQIDRYLTQLKQCGILEKLAGIAFGQFTQCKDEQYLPELFKEFATGPSCYGVPFGHILPSAVFQVGQNATLSVSTDGIVEFY